MKAPSRSSASGGKVLGIGLSKTGTTSLAEALVLLGLHTDHYFYDLDALDTLDAGTDVTVARAYKLLDLKYPASKFVLTVRATGPWLASCRRHFAKMPGEWLEQELRRDIFGTVLFDARRFLRAYREHERDVRRYFRGRPDDLLVLDICGGQGWERLCPFLGLPVPDAPFPCANASRPAAQDRSPV